MGKVLDLLEKVSRNEVAAMNVGAWQDVVGATKLTFDQLDKMATFNGYSNFDQMSVDTNPGKLYKRDSAKVVDFFQHEIKVSKVEWDGIFKEFQNQANKLGVSTGAETVEAESSVKGQATKLLEKLNSTNYNRNTAISLITEKLSKLSDPVIQDIVKVINK